MNYEIEKLINKLENILKKDKRFYENRDYIHKKKIQHLINKNSCQNQTIDITSLVNIAKLNEPKKMQPIIIQNNNNNDNIDLRQIVKNLAKLNEDLDKIIN